MRILLEVMAGRDEREPALWITQARAAQNQLDAVTESYLRKVVEMGPGYFLARGIDHEETDVFVTRYLFQICAPGDEISIPGPKVIYRQPELSEGERIRLLAGRSDWQDDQWQDNCGVPGCGHDCCEGRFTVI